MIPIVRYLRADLLYSEARQIAAQEVAAERERWRAAVLHGHIYKGSCPDDTQPDARDDQCPLCVLLGPNEKGNRPA